MVESGLFVEENHFSRLPPELIISIFDRISDAKCLCICSSASKHFAALVLQTRVVFVRIPFAILPSGVIAHTFPVWPSGVLNFLRKLNCVKSVTIRFSFGKSNGRILRKQRSLPLIRWKSDSSTYIFVFANDSTNTEEATNTFITRQIVSHLRDTTLRFCYIKELLAVLPDLKSVSTVDSMKRGSVVLEEGGIASVKEDAMSEGFDDFHVKWWKTSQVKLPFSGCMMKDVRLFSVRKKNGACDGLMEKSLFEEDDEYDKLAVTLIKEEASSESTFALPIEANFADTLCMALLNFILQLEPGDCHGPLGLIG